MLMDLTFLEIESRFCLRTKFEIFKIGRLFFMHLASAALIIKNCFS